MTKQETPKAKLAATPKDIYHEKLMKQYKVQRELVEAKREAGLAEVDYWEWLLKKGKGEK